MGARRRRRGRGEGGREGAPGYGGAPCGRLKGVSRKGGCGGYYLKGFRGEIMAVVIWWRRILEGVSKGDGGGGYFKTSPGEMAAVVKWWRRMLDGVSRGDDGDGDMTLVAPVV